MSLINTFKFCLCLLAVGFAAGNKVSEEDCVVYNLDMESKECAIVAYADAIDIAITEKLLDGFLKVLGVFYIHTPNQFSKSVFSCASSMTCPSGRSLLSLA